MRRILVFLAGYFVLCLPVDGQAMDLSSAVDHAVTTNPRILEAAANRRAVDRELDEATGAYLPRLDIEGAIGPQMLERPNASNAANLGVWRLSREVSLVARQTVFDGFARANEVYRQEARIDGAAARVMERAEVIGLEAVETYLDVLRHRRILDVASRNIRIHRELLARVRTRVDGGSATVGELRQAEERLAGAEAVHADILKAVGAADARFQNVIGREPLKLARVDLPRGLPASQAAAVALARNRHPALQAGGADVNAAEAAFDRTRAPYLPRVDLEGRATIGQDLDGTPGQNNDFSVRLSMSWNIFNGGIDRARRMREGERVTESKMRLDQLRRTVDETARRAWSDISANDLRRAALKRQTAAASAVIATYDQEFEAGLRDLLDLLDAQSSAFNVDVQLISAETIAVFARYRLLAATGGLLRSFNITPPAESIALPRERPWFVGGRPLIEPLNKW